jgi:hypothetical protein
LTEQPINDRRRARARADRAGRRARRASGAARAWRVLFGIVVLVASLTVFGGRASAVQSVRVSVDSDAIDLTRAVERYSAQGDRIQVSTAPGADGIVRRIEVSALEPGAQPAWIVFALTNDSDEQLTRLIVAPHFRFVGSGVIWPDLGSSRIATITASQGSAPEREDNPDGGCLPPDPRSGNDRDLCRRAADAEPAAALSVGAGRVQGQVDQPHPLRRAS